MEQGIIVVTRVFEQWAMGVFPEGLYDWVPYENELVMMGPIPANAEGIFGFTMLLDAALRIVQEEAPDSKIKFWLLNDEVPVKYENSQHGTVTAAAGVCFDPRGLGGHSWADFGQTSV